MAESKAYVDARSEKDVQKENNRLVKDIHSYCSQRHYKKTNVLLIGTSGSGKSSIINTLLKVIIGEYIPRAKAGSGDVTSCTLDLKCYKSCGTTDMDFQRNNQQERKQGIGHTFDKMNKSTHNDLLWTVRDQLPNIFDVAPMRNVNDEDTKEKLRLLVDGRISTNTNIVELMRLQKRNGLGYLPMRYRPSINDNKISMILFACSCTSSIPYNLIKCVREVLQEVDPSTSSNKYDTDIFVLITKYDKVKTVGPIVHTTAASGDSSVDCSIETIDSQTIEIANDHEKENDVNESNITLNKFNEVTRKITKAFIHTGTSTYRQLYWTSYNDFIGYDNIFIDNKALKLLKALTTPLQTEELPSMNIRTDQSINILVDLLFRIRNGINYNIQLNVSHMQLRVAFITLFVCLLCFVCF